METLPATSLTVPLLGKYITFTMIMVTLSVVISVWTLNARYRSSGTHTMSKYTKMLCFQVLPRFLFMDFPGTEVVVPGSEDIDIDFDEEIESDMARLENPFKTTRNRLNPEESKLDHIYGDATFDSTFIGVRPDHMRNADLSGICNLCSMRKYDKSRRYPAQVIKALDGVAFVAKHLRDDAESTQVNRYGNYSILFRRKKYLVLVRINDCFDPYSQSNYSIP